MFAHILVPTDLTERSVRTAEVAVGMASSFGASTTLLHVIETIPGATFEELDEFYRKLEERARAAMAAQVERISSAGVDLRQQVVYGSRSKEILRFAADEGIDLIVLASHQLEPARGEGGLGAISYRVGLLSTCPVLLLK